MQAIFRAILFGPVQSYVRRIRRLERYVHRKRG